MGSALVGGLGRGARLVGVAVMVLSVLAPHVLGVGPHTGRYQTATVLSASMRPTFAEGSVGHVIMYRIPAQDRRMVAHRVVEIVEEGQRPVVHTQGDANPEPGAWTARVQGETLWQVRGAVPKLGLAVQALRNPLLRALSVGVVPVVLALLWLVDICGPQRRATRRVRPSPRRRAVEGTHHGCPYAAGRRPALTVALVAFCATMVAPANAASFSDTGSAAHTISSAVLDPASNLTATTGCGPLLSFSADATLSWTATPSAFAAGYTVERWQGSSLESTTTVTPRTTTTTTQTGLRTDTSTPGR